MGLAQLEDLEIQCRQLQVLLKGTNCLFACKIRCSHIFVSSSGKILRGLQIQETLDSLPKAIRSSISHRLFYSLLDKVYLFRGVSNDLLFQLGSEMKAEYFHPEEEVILQNEAPTDFYILVTRVVDVVVYKNGSEQAS
ncbi:Potassium channel AKT1 [Euphorbia peplus]|nr:Potassium channel AKT1 [Euphorbia peplus]